MGAKRINLLSSRNRYVFIVARKLHKGDRIVVSDVGQCKKSTSSDWGFESVFPTLHEAEKTMNEHIRISREFHQGETYGIISMENGRMILLKSERG